MADGPLPTLLKLVLLGPRLWEQTRTLVSTFDVKNMLMAYFLSLTVTISPVAFVIRPGKNMPSTGSTSRNRFATFPDTPSARRNLTPLPRETTTVSFTSIARVTAHDKS